MRKIFFPYINILYKSIIKYSRNIIFILLENKCFSTYSKNGVVLEPWLRIWFRSDAGVFRGLDPDQIWIRLDPDTVQLHPDPPLLNLSRKKFNHIDFYIERKSLRVNFIWSKLVFFSRDRSGSGFLFHGRIRFRFIPDSRIRVNSNQLRNPC